MRKKVTKVLQSGDFESQYGHFYKWLLEFEDGFKGEYLSKTETQNKFIEGQEADIEVTTRDYNGTKINKIKPIFIIAMFLSPILINQLHLYGNINTRTMPNLRKQLNTS